MISNDKILILPLALLLAIAVGIPLASERTSAALPLISDCPSAMYNFLTSDFSPELIEHTLKCTIGLALFALIPGAIGIFLLLMKD